MILSPLPSIMPGETIADAIAISSAVSPEEGVTTSIPELNRASFFGAANVFTERATHL